MTTADTERPDPQDKLLAALGGAVDAARTDRRDTERPDPLEQLRALATERRFSSRSHPDIRAWRKAESLVAQAQAMVAKVRAACDKGWDAITNDCADDLDDYLTDVIGDIRRALDGAAGNGEGR